MKKKLLLVAVAVLSCLGIQAQGWAEPEAPTTGSDVVSGHVYRIKNVAASAVDETNNPSGEGYFLSGGSSWYSWSTSTVLVNENENTPLSFKVVETADGWTFARTSDGKYTFISGASPQQIENTGEMHVDQGSQAAVLRLFGIQKVGDYYRVYAAKGNTAFNIPVYDGDTPTLFWGWKTNNYEGDYPWAVYGTVSPDAGYGCDWEFIDYSFYEARLNLYNLQDEASEYEVDMTAADAVYNNASATLEELTDAYDNLKKGIAAAKTSAILDGASEENPIDGTELIENSDFSAGNINGWDCTFVSGVSAANVGYQGASYTGLAWEDEETGDAGTAYFEKFIEAWSPNSDTYKFDGRSYATIGDGKLYQTIYGLPAGKYKLSADVNAVQQHNSSINPVVGVQLYAIGGTLDASMDMATGNGVPEHFILSFIHTGGDVELGLRTSNTTANWIGADNFKLMYYGPISEDPYKVLLDDYIKSVQAKYPDMDEVKANAEIKEATATAIENAMDATDDYQQVKADLEAQVAKLDASVKLYKEGKDGLDEIQEKMAQCEDSYPDLSAELSDYHSVLKEKYDNGTATEEDFAGISASINQTIATYVSENCKPGDDVTILLNNPGFTKGFSGWTTGGNGVAWQANYAQGENSAEAVQGWTEEQKPARVDGLAERWHAKFTMTQTIKNMPRGLYQLSCQGFNRHDDGENDAAAQLYAILPDGSVQTAPFADINDYATEECLVVLPDDTQWAADKQNDEGLWIPNGMTASAWHFMNKSDGENYDYVSKFNIVMTEAGDLTVGARCEYEHQWVIFDNFRIVYKGNGARVYDEAIKDKQTLLEAELDNAMSAEAAKVIEEALKAGDAAIAGDDEEASIAALKTMDAALERAKESEAMVAKLNDAYVTMTEYRMMEIESSEESFADYLDEIAEALDLGEFESDAQIQGYIDGMNEGFTKYVQYDYLDATEADPADITAVIYNTTGVDPVTQANSTNGWTAAVGSATASNNEIEIYNQKFDFYQTIRGLAPGYYRLYVQGLYRNGWPANVAAAERGETYEVVSYDTISVDPLELDTIRTEVPYENNAICELYAGNTTTSLALISSDAARWAAVEGSTGNTYTDAEGNNVVYVNSMAQAESAFSALDPETGDNMNLYQNILQFEVKEGDGAINIGVRKSEEVGGDWTIFTNWQLYYLGTATPEEDPTTEIAGVETAPVATSIYDLTGRRVEKAQKGIYVINGKKYLVK